MKRLIATILVAGVVILGLETSVLKAETKNGKSAETAKAGETVKGAQAAVDVNDVEDVNQSPGEPNEVDEVMRKFEQVSNESGKAFLAATRLSTENRVKMLEASQKQTEAELNFIRNLAIEEGASKTVKAVDIVIEKRKERFEQMIQSAKERQERDTERTEREAKLKEKERSPRRRRP